MTETEELLESLKLERQLLDYWHDVDVNSGRNAGKYYTEDAVFDGGLAIYDGRAKIEQFYAWRLKRGPRVAVHAVTNFRARFQSATRAVCTWYMLLYAADGKPVLPSHPPDSIALITDHMEKQPDGRWLCASRKFDALFMGETPFPNPNLDEGPGGRAPKPSASGRDTDRA